MILLALATLAVPLQAVLLGMQQPGDCTVTHRIPFPPQLRLQIPYALARPAQQRLWIPTHRRLNQAFQSLNQSRLLIAQLLAPAPPAPNPPAPLPSLRPQVLQAPVDGLAAHAGNLRQPLHATASVGACFRRHQYSPLQLVHQRQHTRKLQSQFARSLLHSINITKSLNYVSVIISQALNIASSSLTGRTPGIGADHATAVTINRVFAAPDLETVQMFIVPTERDLQYFVESGHRVIAAHQ